MWLNDWIHEDESAPIPFQIKGVGTGYANSGKRRTWSKSDYFEQDLLSLFAQQMTLAKFKARFIHSPSEIKWFFDTIKANAVRKLETMHHSRNKMLLLLDRLHNCLSAQEMSDKYRIGCKTAYDHCSDITKAILDTYGNDKEVISFPSKRDRKTMIHILKSKNSPVPTALFCVDGTDTRCTGRNISERRSRKYKWLPCFKVFLQMHFLSDCIQHHTLHTFIR